MAKKSTWLRIALCALVLLLAAGLFWFFGRVPPEEMPPPETSPPTEPVQEALLTIDTHPVSEDEFRLFLQNERASVSAYYHAQHGVDLNEVGWDADINGTTPNEYAKASALSKLVAAKMESILLHEWGELDDLSYETFLHELAQENEARRKALEAGEVIYGLREYSPATYYSYIRTSRWAKLLLIYEEQASPTEEELLALYQENIDFFQRGTDYHYRVTYADGEIEELEASENSVAKEDYETRELLTYLATINPGESLTGGQYRGRDATITLLSAAELGEMPFEECRGTVESIYVEESLRALVASRVAQADITINDAKWNEISAVSTPAES